MPSLMRGFLSNSFFNKNIELCLMDIDEENVNDTYDYFNKVKKLYPQSDIGISKTMDLDISLDGASYVVVSIAHGGLDAAMEDHRIARRYGFYNLKGTEVGIAGCSRTIRHVPEIVRIAKRMEKKCPDAWMLNVTNPLTAVTRAVKRYTSIKCAGFCHGVRNHLKCLFPLFGADGWDGVEFNVAGVDHCSWHLDIKHFGRDVLKMLRDKGWIERAKLGNSIAGYDDPFAGRENQRIRFLIWDIIGYFPAISDEHICEFFGQVTKDKETREYYKVYYDRIVERPRTKSRDRKKLKMMLDGTVPLEGGRVSEQIDDFIAALNGGGTYVDVLNYPNEGQIPNLPGNMVVETKCTIDSTGVHPHQTGDLPPILDSIVRPIGIREELYMEASMENNPDKLKAALNTDPLVNDFRNINELCRELMDYNRQFLT